MPARWRRALITGASSGIGTAFAAELPATTDLLLTGRDQQRLDALRERLDRPDRTVRVLAADLTTADGLDRVVDAAEAFGIDLLINNAGSGRFGAVLDNPIEDEIDTVRLNVVAVVALTRRLLPGMLARAADAGRRAGVVVVSSTAAFAPVPYFATYSASKAFDLHFTEALAEELKGAPVDVLALCPSATRTAFGARAGYGFGDLPGAADPRAVARDALDALGRRTVHVGGTVGRAALGPVVLPRRLMTGAIGMAMRFLVPGNR
jgi:hypothetical protein